MRHLFALIFFLFIGMNAHAQQMQWASKVIAKSSEYGKQYYAAQQVLGVPNAINGSSTEMMAWAPAKEANSTGAFIHVGYTVPMRIQQIVVVESKNPGAIKRITLHDTSGKRHIIYDNNTPQPVGKPSQCFVHTFPLTNYKVKEVSVQLKTAAVEGSNHIDAIGISASAQLYKKEEKANTLNYEKGLSKAENLGLQINSAFAERLPIIAPDGKTLWFARKYHPKNIGDDNNDDIWVSNLQGGDTWSRPVNAGMPLNDARHNFVFAVNPAGNKIWLANEYFSSKKDGISYSNKHGRVWSRPKNVRINDHYNDSPFVCYHISTDERVLLMSVERKDGLGQNDLYVSFRISNKEFSKPISLGHTINTVGDECSIFLAADGKTVYFSSNGHQGYGGYDMYRSQRLDETWQNWSTPLNLGKEINSPENDYNYTIPASGDYAYFSRDNASGMSDLFRIKLPKEVQPEPVVFVTGQLIDANTKRPLGGVLNLDNKSKNDKLVSDDYGKFAFILPYGKNVAVFAEKSGYYPISEQIQLAEQIEELDSDNTFYRPEEQSNNKDIAQMQMRLNDLEQDLSKLKEKEDTKPIVLQKESEQTSNKPYSSDSNILKLKKKYEEKILELTQENSLVNFKPKGEEVNNNEKNAAQEEDAELARMKRTFNKEHGKSTTRPKGAVTTKDTNERGDNLSNMKDKFNRLNGKEKANPKKPKAQKAAVTAFLHWEELEKATRTEAKKELLPIVYNELSKELLKDVKEELAQTLDADGKAILKKLKPNLTIPQVSTPKNNSVLPPLPNWIKNIQEELKLALEFDIKFELREQLSDEVNQKLRRHLEYKVKEEIKTKVKKELEQEIKLQIEKEKNHPSPAVITEEDKIEEAALEPTYKEIEKDILLAPIIVGQVIPMNNIFFDSNEATLKTESTDELKRVTTFLQKNSNLIIEIGGHTNDWCSHSFANELSANRALTVRDYLVEQGIDSDRIKTHGYGKTQAIASNKTKAGRRKNQRVEMKILEIK